MFISRPALEGSWRRRKSSFKGRASNKGSMSPVGPADRSIGWVSSWGWQTVAFETVLFVHRKLEATTTTTKTLLKSAEGCHFEEYSSFFTSALLFSIHENGSWSLPTHSLRETGNASYWSCCPLQQHDPVPVEANSYLVSHITDHPHLQIPRRSHSSPCSSSVTSTALTCKAHKPMLEMSQEWERG